MRSLVKSMVFVTALALVGCGSSAPTGVAGGGRAGPSEIQKTITIGALNPIKGFGPWNLGTTQGGAASLANIHSNTLTTTDAGGNLEPRLATRLPSPEDGTIVVLPDGRMRSVWRLRPNVKWQDGAPFTAEDVVFGWQAAAHPEVPSDQVTHLRNIETIEALDSQTAVITWKTTFFQSLMIGPRDGLWPLPRHLLAEAFEGDKTEFLTLPYWTAEYVHLGPFRVVDYRMGERLVFHRFDDYFLGRPKVGTIVMRIIPDGNTLFANLQSRAVDIVTEDAMPDDLFAELRAEWRRTREGVVVERQGNWKFLSVQFSPEHARPPELSRDVRVRRGLYFGIDREALRELLFPGFANTEAHSFMVKTDSRATAVGQPFARYPYDPTRSAQELAEAGWRQSRDGRLLNARGEQVQIDLRGTSVETKESALIASYWRQLGIDTQEETMPSSLLADRRYRTSFPGFEIVARGNGDSILARFNGRALPTAQNRYAGTNGGSYGNPALDRLIDRLYGAIDRGEQGQILRDISEILATDLPALPTYFRIRMAAVGRGIQALSDDYAGAILPGLPSRNAHLWDRE